MFFVIFINKGSTISIKTKRWTTMNLKKNEDKKEKKQAKVIINDFLLPSADKQVPNIEMRKIVRNYLDNYVDFNHLK